MTLVEYRSIVEYKHIKSLCGFSLPTLYRLRCIWHIYIYCTVSHEHQLLLYESLRNANSPMKCFLKLLPKMVFHLPNACTKHSCAKKNKSLATTLSNSRKNSTRLHLSTLTRQTHLLEERAIFGRFMFPLCQPVCLHIPSAATNGV